VILFAAWLTLLTVGSTAFGGGVIYRTSFEKQLAPWFSYFARGLVWDDSKAHSGTRSLLIERKVGETFEGRDAKTKVPPNVGWWWSTATHRVEPSTPYSVSCWALSELGEGEAGLTISFYAKDGRYLEMAKQFRLVNGTSPGWVEMGATFTTPPDVGAIKVGMITWDPVGRVRFDDLVIRKGTWEVTVPYTDRGTITVDGVVGPAEWKNAAVLKDFERLGTSGVPRPAAERDTVVYMMNDWERLYVGAVCQVADPKEIAASSRKRDGRVWDDSCLELFFDLRGDGTSYVHYIVNAAGAYYDAYCRGGAQNAGWDSDITTATARREDAWTCELAIPLRSVFSLNPVDNPERRIRIAMNVAREEQAGRVLSSWAPLGAKGGFHAPARFIAATIDGNPGNRGDAYSFRHRGVHQFERTKVVRTWRVEDPLFAELISDRPKRFPGEAAVMWSNPIWPWGRDLALQYGFAWDHHATARELSEHNVHLFISYFGWPHWPKEVAEQTHCLWGLMMAPQYTTEKSRRFATSRGALLIDPERRKGWLDSMTRYMDEWPLWCVSIGDEIVNHETENFFQMKTKFGDQYPYLREARRKIRDQYGFGKYGCPDAMDDDDPFEWIAYWRWFLDQYLAVARDFSATARAKRPGIVTISSDPPWGLVAQHLSRQAPYFDLFAGQLYHPSRDMQNFGFTTKLIADLSGKDTWPVPHSENYSVSLDDEELNDVLSEAVRVGATGFQFYPGDTIGRARRVNLSPSCREGHRPRWDALLAIVDRMRTMNQLKFPTPNSAILFAENTCHSVPKAALVYRSVYDSLFTMIGPRARTWFKFVSDIQLEDRQVDLTKFKVLFVPSAKYESKGVRAQVRSYVENGGTLVIFDPEAFAWGLDGTDRHDFTATLAGAALAEPTDAQVIATSELGRSKHRLSLASRTARWVLRPTGIARVVAQYDDGKPAVVKHALGNGSVYYFGANPCTEDIVYSRAWIAFFEEFCTVLGLKTGQDIWRFRFDIPKFAMPKEVEGSCLTNNYFQWVLNEPVTEANVLLANGKYRYEGAKPDLYPEPVEVTFRRGKLTDRNRAIDQMTSAKGNYGAPTEPDAPRFVVGWRTLSPCTVIFDLGEAREVSTIRAFASGEVPRLAIRGGPTEQKMAEVATCSAPPKGDGIEVRKLEATFPGRRVRYVSLAFEARKVGRFVLAEVDIWGR